MLGIMIFCSIVLTGCLFLFFTTPFEAITVIQSIEYGKKKIEVYVLNAGSFTTETIHVSIFSRYNRHSKPTRIFWAPYYSSKINISLSMEKETPILEVFYYNIRADEIRLKKEFVDGIKVVYIEVDKNYDFIGYKL